MLPPPSLIRTDSCCTRLQQGWDGVSLSEDVVLLLCWKRADRKGYALLSTYLQTEDKRALGAIRENTAAVASGRDPAPRSLSSNPKWTTLPLGPIPPSLADTAFHQSVQTALLFDCAGRFVHPDELRLQLLPPRKRLEL